METKIIEAKNKADLHSRIFLESAILETNFTVIAVSVFYDWTVEKHIAVINYRK